MKLQHKLSLGAFGLVAMVVVGGGALTYVSERRILKQELRNHQEQVVLSLAKVCEESVYQNDLAVFNYIRTLAGERGFLAAAFVNKSGDVTMHSDPKKIRQRIASPRETEANSARAVFVQAYLNDQNQRVLDLTAPVRYSLETIGTARLLLSQDALDSFVAESSQQPLLRIFLISLLSLLAGVIGASLLARAWVQPIQSMVKGMEVVANGKFVPLRLPERKDELGWLSQQLDAMIGKLGELDQLKEDFVSGITHDLKSPAGNSVLSIHMLLRSKYGPVTADQRETLLTVENNLTRLLQLIDDLLTASKIESGTLELDIKRCDISGLMKEVSAVYQPLFQEKGIRYDIDTPPGPTLAWADPDRTLQILNNLFSNAFKYTSAGSVHVRLVKHEDRLLITVADTGVGLSQEDASHLFERFFRATRTAKGTAGTGLGLFISKRFVEAQGGEMGYTPAHPGGSSFWFTLPAPPTSA